MSVYCRDSDISTFLPFCLTVMSYSADNYAFSHLLLFIGHWGRARCSLDVFLFFFSPLCSVWDELASPGKVLWIHHRVCQLAPRGIISGGVAHF